MNVRLRVLVAALAAGCLAMTGCSSTTDTSQAATSARSTDAPEWLKDIDADVQAQYQGKYLDVIDSGPKAAKGDNVWYISCGEAISGCAAAGAGFKEAAQALGWNVTYVDGKFDPNEVSNGIKQAVSAGATAIGMNVFDCAAVKTALEQAAAANIPVVSTWSTDCSPSLMSVTTLGGLLPPDGLKNYTTDKVKWGISNTGGQAKFIDISQTDLGSTIAQEQGYQEALTSCPTCSTVATVEFTTNTMANLQNQVAAALAQHPEANAINMPYSGLLSAGVQSALAQAGRTKDMSILGGACDGTEFSLMKQGWNIACSGYDQGQTGWMTADYLNRLLSGEDAASLPKKGIGYQLVDPAHQQSGDTFQLPVDYRAAYKRVWAGQ